MPRAQQKKSVDPARKKSDHNTPEAVLSVLRRVGPMGLDPASNPWSTVGARVELSKHRGDDGLAEPWHAHLLPKEQCFVNPPYDRGQIVRWVDKATREDPFVRERGAFITMLVPADPSTAAFQSAWRSCNAFCLWGSRLQFLGSRGDSNPWPSVIWFWGRQAHRFCHFLEPHGIVQVLRGGP